MRIIAGTYRGRKISATRDLSIRPTTDRVKQTVFDILGNRVPFEGIDVLDLFAGSGSLGLEAISRGAGSATFIEKSPVSLKILEKNIRSLGCEDRVSVHLADVFWYLKHPHKVYDLVFADPPFRLETIGTLPSAIAASGAIRKGTYVVMEHGRDSEVAVPEASFETIRKTFGHTVVLILKVLQA